MGVASSRAAGLLVARRLVAAGHRALFAGGCVRDRLLGLAPGDYDVATSAHPEEVVALFPRAVTVGARFGVVVVPLRGGASEDAPAGGHPGRVEADAPLEHVEVATFRADGRYVDGRRPEGVVFSDPKTDASRPDF